MILKCVYWESSRFFSIFSGSGCVCLSVSLSLCVCVCEIFRSECIVRVVAERVEKEKTNGWSEKKRSKRSINDNFAWTLSSKMDPIRLIQLAVLLILLYRAAMCVPNSHFKAFWSRSGSHLIKRISHLYSDTYYYFSQTVHTLIRNSERTFSSEQSGDRKKYHFLTWKYL